MKLLLIKIYLQIIIILQYTLLKISKVAMFVYGPLPTCAMQARILIEEIKNERTMDRKVSSKNR